MSTRADQPRPPRKPMKTCPNCGKANEPHRNTCWSCHKPFSRAVQKRSGVPAASRICRTPEQAFAAGWADAADDPPLTAEQCVRLAALLGPYIRPAQEAA